MAALNVLFGRYKIVPNEVKEIVRGNYGRVPGKNNAAPQVKKSIISSLRNWYGIDR